MKLPTVNAALIKVTGVFSYKRNDIRRFLDSGYESIPLSEQPVPANCEDVGTWKREQVNLTRKYYRDTYYREFSSLMFTGSSDWQNMRALQRRRIFELVLLTGNPAQPKQVKVTCTNQELFLFDKDTGILSLTFRPEELSFPYISDMIHGLRSFDTKISFSEKQCQFHLFISEELIANIPLRGKSAQSDDYSGSKFKIYSVISTDEADNGTCYERDKLVYEIGTGSRIKELDSNGFNSPSQAYFEELMTNSIKVFRNYTGLALLDSFTIIGQDVYKAESDNFFSHNTYNRVYFAIYIFNLYLRYNLFRFNTIFMNDPIKTRDEFQMFLNRYNYSHISFNFLPNIFYKKIHDAMGIDDEVAQFEKRLSGLASQLQEQQEKRQATLLGLVSVLTGLSSTNDILNLLEKGRIGLGWSMQVFYSLIIVLILILAIPILSYLFPELARKARRKFLSQHSSRHGDGLYPND